MGIGFIYKFYRETIIVLLAALLQVVYYAPFENTISSDGEGHYEYLPSIFIHNDFVRYNSPADKTPEKYCRIDNEAIGYVIVGNHRLNKYPYGTALLQLPFFVTAWLFVDESAESISGYEDIFQISVYIAALIYLLLALVFVRRTLNLYGISSFTITVIELILVFATPLLYYTYGNAAYGHVYSFFSISAFIFFSSKFFSHNTSKSFILASVFLALTVVIRNFNILILLALPFIAGSWQGLQNGMNYLIRRPKILASGIVILSVSLMIQFFLYFLQTGHWFLDSYPGEHFNFKTPAYTEVLFSFRKGLFIYTPIFLLSLLGVLNYFKRHSIFHGMTWISWFFFLTYTLSSWWLWSNGSSFGQRVYIDYYILFVIPIAVLIEHSKQTIRMALLSFSALCMMLNVFQIYQYKHYILKWDHMTASEYWEIFLKSNMNLEGFLWRPELKEENIELIDFKEFGIIEVASDTNITAIIIDSRDVRQWEEVEAIKVSFETDFNLDSKAKFIFCIGDTLHLGCDFYSEFPLFHFAPRADNGQQTGSADFYFKPDKKKIRFIKSAIEADHRRVTMKNVKIFFFKQAQNYIE